MDEVRGIALSILGIVAILATVGLVLLFTGATGMGLYGGELTRVPGVDLYEKGESVPRYTKAVPPSDHWWSVGTPKRGMHMVWAQVQVGLPFRGVPEMSCSPSHFEAASTMSWVK